MRRSSTSALAVALACVAAAAPAEEWRTSLSPGVTLHFPSERWSHSDTGSWHDQYEWMPHEGSPVPWFLDLMHAESGWLRDDETWLLHLERTSPTAYAERTLLDLDWRGLRVEGEAFRFLTEELRVFPVGTGDTGFPALPRLGSHFTDDSDPDDRFVARRYGGGGEIRFRPGDAGIGWSPLTQLSFFGSQELRTGRRQDRFLLDTDESGNTRLGRFRGRTRELDQEVTTVGGRFVAAPFDLATGVAEVAYQRFHENAPTALVGDIDDPAVTPVGTAAERALFFLPDTSLWSGSLRVSRRIGEATLHAGAFASRLAQTGAQPPLQTAAGLDGNDVRTLSAHAAADVPLGRWLDFDAYGKIATRRNGLDRQTSFFEDDNRTQLAPFLKQRRDVRAGAELSAKPMRGAKAGVGWRMRDVDRDLDYAKPIAEDGFPNRSIQPPVSLVGDDSEQQEIYLRGHARLHKRTRVAGEVGWAWAPSIGGPNELERALFAEWRASHGVTAPIPLTLSFFGHFRSGSADDAWELESRFDERSEHKDYERRTLDWGFSITAVPRRGSAVYLTLTRQLDRQRFPHVRSNVVRPTGEAFLEFYRDSDLGWETDARILALGATQQVTRAIDLSLAGWLAYVDGEFGRGGHTADALNHPNTIDLAYGSIEAAAGIQLRPELRLGLAYRFDAYRDDARQDEPKRDGRDHAITLSATYEFSIVGSPP
jgi:hypothetical protein